jgi:beta-galactosidase/beta-glucuronidase
MKRILSALLSLMICTVIYPQALVLRNGWQLKSTLEVNATAQDISKVGYNAQSWYPTTVPSTVLSAFVRDGVYPNPLIGLNNYLIPDVSDAFNRKLGLAKYSYLKDGKNPWKDPYWFRTEVVLPSTYKGKTIWLEFKGINYRADIWVNGHQVADHQDVAGMFRRFKFDITRYCIVGSKNCLAVKIYQVDHPGDPQPGTQLKVFGNTRGHCDDIFQDETMKMSGGWDCAPLIHDRNMGIYQDVVISTTGKVSIENPYVVSTLPNHDATKANLTISAEIKNTSGKVVSGLLKAQISLLNDIEFPTYTKHITGYLRPIQIEKEISLQPGETKTITFSPDKFPSLCINKPYLWYPNGYGEQYLHHLKLSFLSDVKELDFGIREVTTRLEKRGDDYGRVFMINDKRIFCKGGWLQPDAMLQADRKRIFDEARLLAEANVNIVGSEDAPSPPDEVLESFDKYGLMYWSVFFQCYRMYPGTPSEHNPLDHKLATTEVRDIVRRYRNNPSVIAWFATNEVIVDEDLYRSTRQAVKALDPSRPFIPTTSHDWNIDRLTPYMKEDMPTGTTDDGEPDYRWCPPAFFFNKVEEVHLQQFRNELGVPSIPLYSSLRKFIPTSAIRPAGTASDSIFPLDSIWAEHGAWDGEQHYCFGDYDHAIRRELGQPLSCEDYAQKAQIVNADSYRAMFEAANHRMWDITSGVMIWKLNSCWPDVGWQIYDWYLNPNASYFFTKRAMEPIHIQMNANDHRVSIINTTSNELKNVHVNAEIVDVNMNVKQVLEDNITIGADCYKESFSIPQITDTTSVYFVKLVLEDSSHHLLSDNLYWLSANDNFKQLVSMPKVTLKQEVDVSDTGKEYHITLHLLNNTDKISFFNHFTLLNPTTREEILPAFWSDNFITLFPSESKTMTVVVAKQDANGQYPLIVQDN